MSDNGGRTNGHSGGAVWGAPAIDPATRTAYFTTGQNDNVSQSVHGCQGRATSPTSSHAPDPYIDSVMALDMRTGKDKWASGARFFRRFPHRPHRRLPATNCPAKPGSDYGFGEGAHLFTINDNGNEAPSGRCRTREWRVLAAGCWTRRPAKPWGAWLSPRWKLWRRHGGGTATDGERAHGAEANSNKPPHQLADGMTTSDSSFATLDPATGKILWQIADPTDGFAWSGLTVANGVLHASTTSGHMYAIDTANVSCEEETRKGAC